MLHEEVFGVASGGIVLHEEVLGVALGGVGITCKSVEGRSDVCL